MKYFLALFNYLQTEKARHDVLDYLRAGVIIAATMLVVRTAFDMARQWLLAH